MKFSDVLLVHSAMGRDNSKMKYCEIPSFTDCFQGYYIGYMWSIATYIVHVWFLVIIIVAAKARHNIGPQNHQQCISQKWHQVHRADQGHHVQTWRLLVYCSLARHEHMGEDQSAKATLVGGWGPRQSITWKMYTQKGIGKVIGYWWQDWLI